MDNYGQKHANMMPYLKQPPTEQTAIRRRVHKFKWVGTANKGSSPQKNYIAGEMHSQSFKLTKFHAF